MKTFYSAVALSAALALQIGCNDSAPKPVANSASNADRPMRSEQMREQNSIAHTTENAPPDPKNPGKFAQGGEPIDTAKFDGTIAEFEKTHKAKPSDETVKKNLAQAYFDRGVALTDARQYASALGDYRRALKLDPTHKEAEKWVMEISRIFVGLKKEVPKEGQEPPPLPFKKAAA